MSQIIKDYKLDSHPPRGPDWTNKTILSVSREDLLRLLIAGDILGHQLLYTTHKEVLDFWWRAREKFGKCSQCDPDAPQA